MISTLEKEITFRFLKARKKDGFLNIISIFSFIGISLGVAVLIIVMSVMNGFRTELINKIVGFNAHITVKPYENVIEIEKLKLNNLKLISDGDVSGALLVSDKEYNIDIFMGIGGGPEGVLAASALDAFDCFFQGRFIFDNENDVNRAKKMGIDDLNKKYLLNEIITGDSIFCATGITNGDIVSGIKIEENNYISETLVTHKSTNLKKIIKSKNKIDE